MSTPIADLSYRNYDGPLDPPTYRWWVIARMHAKMAIKKKGFWVWSTFVGLWYLILGAVFYFTETIGTNMSRATGGNINMMQQIIWKDQFLRGFSTSQLFLFILALLVGAGAIANDNKANALLVYLSKPSTKKDYLLGKWMGIFMVISGVTAVHTLLFYGYCLLSYRQYGFVSQDPWLILKLLGLIVVPGAVHASLTLGISSLFNQGRLAGAAYAALFFLTLFFTKIVEMMRLFASRSRGDTNMFDSLFYASVDGLQFGLAKAILGTAGSSPFPGVRMPDRVFVPAPNLVFILAIALVVCALSMSIAWRKVRAVEVIGS